MSASPRSSERRVIAIVQARMSSRRLPGKVLVPLAGQPVLWHVLKRLAAVRGIDDVLVATSVDSSDDPIEAACVSWRIRCVRGPLDDVLARFCMVLDVCPADVVVRMPSDKPLLDPGMVSTLLAKHLAEGVDYTTNMGPRWPDDGLCPMGHETEIVNASALRNAAERASLPSEREHVTPYLYAGNAGFRVQRVLTPNPFAPHHPRLNLDTPEDLAVLRAIYEGTPPGPLGILEAESIKAFLQANPDLTRGNAMVPQRGYR